MSIWLVKFSECGFRLDAVVVATSWKEAVALLKLSNATLFKDCERIGTVPPQLDQTPRVVTQDKLEYADR